MTTRLEAGLIKSTLIAVLLGCMTYATDEAFTQMEQQDMGAKTVFNEAEAEILRLTYERTLRKRRIKVIQHEESELHEQVGDIDRRVLALVEGEIDD